MTKKLLSVVGAGLAERASLSRRAPWQRDSARSDAAQRRHESTGSPHRYVAVNTHTTPNAHPGRADRQARRPRSTAGGSSRVTTASRRWLTTASPGGLSADGRTLVLSDFAIGNPPVYPPKTTRLAILDTELRPQRHLQAGAAAPAHVCSARSSLRGQLRLRRDLAGRLDDLPEPPLPQPQWAGLHHPLRGAGLRRRTGKRLAARTDRRPRGAGGADGGAADQPRDEPGRALGLHALRRQRQGAVHPRARHGRRARPPASTCPSWPICRGASTTC